MQFDSNRAWNEALAEVKANRDVLLAVGGVFFLLPTLLSAVFLTDVQAAMMQNLGKEAVLQQLVAENAGMIFGLGFGGALVQGIGYLAVMALLSDRGRPTVGEALGRGLRALPTLVAASVVYLAGLFLLTGILSAALGLLGKAGGVLALVIVLALLVYTSVKFALIVPVVVKEGVANPIAALTRSWRLTKSNSLRLFGFFVLLMLGYMAISFMATIAVVGPLALLVGQGKVLTFVAGLVSGVIGAVASVVLTAVLARIHGQLAGEDPAAVTQPFE